MTKHLVVLLADLRGGGAELAVLNILRHIDRAKYQITLLLLKNEGVYWDQIPRDIEVCCCLQAKERIHRNPWKFLKRFVRSVKRADVIIGGVELNVTYLAAVTGWFLRKPSIGVLHTVLHRYVNVIPRWHRIVIPILYRLLTRIVVVSACVGESLASFVPGVSNRIAVIYNMVGMRTHGETEKNGTPSMPKRFIRHPCVLGAGKLHRMKGFDILLEAHGLLARQGLRIQTIILGDGPEKAALRRQAEELGIADDVVLAGFRSDPYAWMREVDVFVHPSHFEGFSMVVVEAMLNNVPVIATDCPGGVGEILQHGKCGMLVPVGDAKALAQAISLMLSDVRVREQYRSAGRDRAKDFSPAAIIPAWERLLEEITQ